MAKLTINTDLCGGCGNCVKNCISSVLEVKDGKAHIVKENSQNCLNCGHCVASCSKEPSASLVKQEKCCQQR